ncbi:hypothetical protein ACFYRL_36490 [Streptomyces goshikiensis]|uniref:hypothetical protein n=1 Tax=Streptomyces goshikiensis TaxID=1942 RepID=UPI0036BAEDCB
MTTENERQLPQQDGAAYEVARDVLVQLIGHAVGRVVVGEEEWAGKRDQWSSLLSRLDPRDASSVQEVLDREAPELKSITEGLNR